MQSVRLHAALGTGVEYEYGALDFRHLTVNAMVQHTRTGLFRGFGMPMPSLDQIQRNYNRAQAGGLWGRLERYLDYKAGELLKVDPAYTSQTCAVCQHVDKEDRKTQAVFQGHTANADHNAAVNILVRGCPWIRSARGVGASAQRGAFSSGTPTTREPGRRGHPASVPSVNPSV